MYIFATLGEKLFRKSERFSIFSIPSPAGPVDVIYTRVRHVDGRKSAAWDQRPGRAGSPFCVRLITVQRRTAGECRFSHNNNNNKAIIYVLVSYNNTRILKAI